MKDKTTRVAIFNLVMVLVLGVVASLELNHHAAAGVDPYPAERPILNSPAVGIIAITPSDSADLPVLGRGIYVGGAGNLVVIGAGDGAIQNGASTANAASLTLNAVGSTVPVYSSGAPGQYILCGDGVHAAEVISGYLTGTTLTVTTGGGSGGNTTANAHNSGTLIAAYAPLNSLNAGSVVPIRARRVMLLNTTATNLDDLY